MNLTRNFKLAEFERSAKALELGVPNAVPPRLMANVHRTAKLLQVIRDNLGTPLYITSGYRGPEVNKAVGGSPTSAHAKALAADFHVKTMDAEALFQAIIGMDLEFDQLIQEFGGWVHIGLSEGPGRQQILRAVRGLNGKTVYRPVGPAELKSLLEEARPSLPIGVRLNNPGNLEWGSPWQGLVARDQSMYAGSGTAQQKRFCQFESPVWGIRAIAVTLITYQDKRVAKDGSKIDTIREIIERWAPAHENDVQAYTAQVRRAVFGDPDAELQFLNVHDYEVMKPLVEAIIRHENGVGPEKTLNSWYDDRTIDEALRLAGIKPKTKEVAKVPVNPSTVGAVVAVSAGAESLIDVLPEVASAISDAKADLTGDSIIGVIIGLVLVAIAVYVAVDQVKKHRQGTLE